MKGKLFLAALLVVGCAGSFDTKIEETQFLLDQGQFAEALVKARELVAEDATNVEAQFLLASSLLGDSVISARTSPRSQCLEEDVGYLGLMACLLDNQGADETAFLTFVRIAPDTTEKIEELQEARDVLIALAATATGTRLKDVYLQLWVARLFEISTTTLQIGLCTGNFNADALSADELDRFQNNLDNVNDDGQNADLPDDFSLNERILEIGNALATEGAATFFTNQNAEC